MTTVGAVEAAEGEGLVAVTVVVVAEGTLAGVAAVAGVAVLLEGLEIGLAQAAAITALPASKLAPSDAHSSQRQHIVLDTLKAKQHVHVGIPGPLS